mgnify:CR=1 FL=1
MPDPRKWAADLLARTDWVVLDTESSGLSSEAQLVQIGVLAPDGSVLLDTLVRPTRPIPKDATALHGITDAMVADAPDFESVFPKLADIVRDGLVVSYNAPFDCRMIAQSLLLDGPIDPEGWAWINAEDVRRNWRWEDAMKAWAAYVGEIHRYTGEYKWQKLPPAPGVKAHSAIGDCRSVLALIERMANDAT